MKIDCTYCNIESTHNRIIDFGFHNTFVYILWSKSMFTVQLFLILKFRALISSICKWNYMHFNSWSYQGVGQNKESLNTQTVPAPSVCI